MLTRDSTGVQTRDSTGFQTRGTTGVRTVKSRVFRPVEPRAFARVLDNGSPADVTRGIDHGHPMQFPRVTPEENGYYGCLRPVG